MKTLILLVLVLLPNLTFARGLPMLCNRCIKDSQRCLTGTVNLYEDRLPASEVAYFCEKKLQRCGAKYKCDPAQLDEIDLSYKKDDQLVIKVKDK